MIFTYFIQYSPTLAFPIDTGCKLYETGTEFLYILLENISIRRAVIIFLASLEGLNIPAKLYCKCFFFQYPDSPNLHPAYSIHLSTNIWCCGYEGSF
jgi:hypothetical protein